MTASADLDLLSGLNSPYEHIICISRRLLKFYMQLLLICETLTLKGAVATGAACPLASRSDCPTFQVRALLPSMVKDGFFCPLTHQHAPCRYAEELSTVGLVGCLKYCSSQARLALSGFSMFRLQGCFDSAMI